MSGNGVDLDEALSLALQLSPRDKVRLIERVVTTLGQELDGPEQRPTRSLLGLCADLGTAPSTEEIDQSRREAWASFPREDAYGC